jgi:hypothetical protein
VDVVQDWDVAPDPVAPKVHSGLEDAPLTEWFAMEMDREIDVRLEPLLRRPFQISKRDGSCECTSPAPSQRTRTRTNADCAGLAGRCEGTYTIFEGTSEIQRLVIARSISGLHIR